MKAFVYSEDVSLRNELICVARQIGHVTAVIIQNEDEAILASEYGSDVMLIQSDEVLLDNLVPTIAGIMMENKPDLFLVGASISDRMVASRVAAAIGVTAIAALKRLEMKDNVLCATQMIFGGGANRTVTSGGNTLIAIARPGMAEAVKAEATGSVAVMSMKPAEKKLRLREIKDLPPSNDGILTAKKVVGVGSGFDSYEQIEPARELASVLGAEMGYSRPLIEGDPPVVPNNPYIGVSGIQIKPDLYIAVGISGQTQHVVGINESKVVACINKDANALMFRHSDYGIVGDMYEVLPVLTKAIQELNQ